MPRKPRLHVAGGFYHVTLRGNGHRAIFFDADDRTRWERLLADGIRRYGHRVHAYCWMTNHIHMAVQCGTEPISPLMRDLASQYARSTNKKMQRSGHLFERRHHLILVQADSYLKALVRYIHQNPLRAGLVEDLAAYVWSSHLAYTGDGSPDWLTVDWVLSLFGDTQRVARQSYGEFMQQSDDGSLSQALKRAGDSDDRLLGDDDFVRAATEGPRMQLVSGRLDKIIERICTDHSITEAELASKSRVRINARIRAQIALEAMDSGAATLATVARRFARSESVLSRSVTRLRSQ